MTEPIDEFQPLFHFRERHARRIEAPPRQVAAQLQHVDLACSPLIGPPFALRLCWRLVRPASGATRREMLPPLARRCSDSISPR